MKLNDILNTKVDIFRCGKKSGKVWFSQKLGYFLSTMTIKNKEKVLKIREINKKNEKEALELKKNELPGCTISATFNTNRLLHCIKERTGLIAVDIDFSHNQNMDIDKAKIDVCKLPFVALSMTSCRGEGIWCLLPYNKENDFKETFNALYDDFKDIGYIIDDNCYDETRLRFISYDDNIRAKKETEIEVYNKTKPIEKKQSTYLSDKEYNGKEWELTKEDLVVIVKSIYLLVTYCNYTSDDYNEWLLDGFRLATIPNKEVGLKLFQMISQNSENYISPKDVAEKYKECCRTTTYNTSILGYYINKVKEHYGDEWKKKIEEIKKN